MTHLPASVALAAGVAAMAAPAAAQDHGWDCKDYASLPQQGINACLADDWCAADARLNDVYQRLMRNVGPSEANTLRAAQRAWITFRDAACDVEAAQMRGGSGEPMLWFGCLGRLTDRRVDDLENLVELYE